MPVNIGTAGAWCQEQVTILALGELLAVIYDAGSIGFRKQLYLAAMMARNWIKWVSTVVQTVLLQGAQHMHENWGQIYA